MVKDCPMLLRLALCKKTSALTAVTVAATLALAPIAPALAQENKGPPVLRDTEAEQLLREYTRPILRAAGLEKQNIQMVIINDNTFNAFVAESSNTRHRSIPPARYAASSPALMTLLVYLLRYRRATVDPIA